LMKGTYMNRKIESRKSRLLYEPDIPTDKVIPVEEDVKPEYYPYRDEGCKLAASCLNCPFPRCMEERPWGRYRWTKDLRDREIVRLYCEQKGSVEDLAERFGVSTRTVKRALHSSNRMLAVSENTNEKEESTGKSQYLKNRARAGNK
jgi:hypothetical protein